ncbi:MAG TPA: hypothetical protein VF789_32795 [Thermoanaerobaculia bacterium]
MPVLTAYADVFRDWEAILGACVRNEGLLPDIGPFRDELTAILQEAREMKLLQEDLEGKRMAATQKLQQRIEDGRESKRKLQAFVMIRLGSKSEHLWQFGIAPLRKRSRKKSELKPPPQEGGEPAKTEPPKPEE